MENEAFGGAHREGGLRVCVCVCVLACGGGLVVRSAAYSPLQGFFFLDGPS